VRKPLINLFWSYKKQAMKIEFNFLNAAVSEHVVDFVRNKLMEFHRENQEVTNAEISFRRMPGETDECFVCQVKLTLFGESLLVHRSSSSYLQSARNVIEEIGIRIEEVLKRINEPPEEVISTIEL
jgi:putative sigma-54 modulation protein